MKEIVLTPDKVKVINNEHGVEVILQFKEPADAVGNAVDYLRQISEDPDPDMIEGIEASKKYLINVLDKEWSKKKFAAMLPIGNVHTPKCTMCGEPKGVGRNPCCGPSGYYCPENGRKWDP